jgi:hypothetical protein
MRVAGADSREVGYGCGKQKCECPIDRDEACPDPLALLTRKIRKMQNVSEAGLVENFDANVAVQCSRYQASDKVENVASDEWTTHRHALVGRVDYVLSLEAVHIDAKEHVDAEDERFGDKECFPEVKGLAHFCHELAVDHRSAVGEDSLHEA